MFFEKFKEIALNEEVKRKKIKTRNEKIYAMVIICGK